MSLELQQHQTNGKKNQQQCMVEKPEPHYNCYESKQRGEQYHFNIALGYTQSLCIRNNDFILYLHDNGSKNVSSRLRLYPIQVIQQTLYQILNYSPFFTSNTDRWIHLKIQYSKHRLIMSTKNV
ncbi:hypothetical protein V8G54_020039 [Vigna mungo]|uniref:Uncharacterized protein n=1 Tax=Vigna mungo TaxID=3915 RepID=A0AAQ3RVJ1_VIGMU